MFGPRPEPGISAALRLLLAPSPNAGGVFSGPDGASARPIERYEGCAGASRHGGKQRCNFRGNPHAAAGGDHRAEAYAFARQARRSKLMLQIKVAVA